MNHDHAKGSAHQLRAFKSRPGGWLPEDPRHTGNWIRKLKNVAAQRNLELVPPIKEFKDMVHSDPKLYANVTEMFSTAFVHNQNTPLGWQPEVQDFDEF